MGLAICNLPPHGRRAKASLATRLPWLAASLVLLTAPVLSAELTQTIERIKPSVVGVGTFLKTRSP